LARPFFLAIEGVIGVGKTTLARLLQPRFRAELLLEAFDENPFLSDFYADRERYAFQTQIFFLLSRFRQRQAVGSLLTRGPLIADYIFAKDSLFAHLNLKGDELTVYERLYEVLVSRVTMPNLVVYLRASPAVCMARIASRDRSYERAMDQSYIEVLWEAYEQYFGTYVETPLLAIDTDELDYVRRPEDLDTIEGQIRARLALGAYQQMLPAFEAAPRVETMPAWSAPYEGSALAQSSWQEAIDEFLVISAAVGRLGAALSGGAREAQFTGTVRQGQEERQAGLQEALLELASRVTLLSHKLGVDLTEVM
jgi:deoxyadenosine/deoxycytidine kinase